jgi:hypothetical protein
MHLSFKQCDVREIAAFQTAVSFSSFFDVEIFAQVNKILEKLVEVKLVEAQVEMTRKILNLCTHLRRRISKICLFFVVKTQSKCEQKKGNNGII